MTNVDFDERLSRFSSTTFKALREAQSHVLREFTAQHSNSPDVAIELPTGTGKTLVGLMIADWALDQGRAVAYLAGTKQLAEQVAAQAVALGGSLQVSQFWSRHYPGAELNAYHQAQSMGLMNYWVYFNSSPKVQPADVVIFDDAHIAEQPLSGMFTIRVGRQKWSKLYRDICEVVLAHTGPAYESLAAMRDEAATLSTPPELLAFNDWSAVAEQVQALISESPFVLDDDVAYVWPDVRGKLDRCGVLIGPSSIEMRPYHPPTQTLAGYSQASQRIYLSATLGTVDDLQRRLGIRKPASITTPAEMAQAQTGRRLFLVNPGRGRADSPQARAFAASLSSRLGRAAWLCASTTEGDEVEEGLRKAGSRTYRLGDGSDDREIDTWAADPEGHLITAGRFDGFDFKGDVCRLVIIPTVPAASTEFERFAVAYLSDATFMRHRIGQRVTQALGRANRDAQDWAIYLGLDPAFGIVLAEPAVATSLADDVKPTIRVALERHGSEDWGPLQDAADAFIAGEEIRPGMVATRPGRRASGSTSQSSTADAEVESVTALWLGNFDKAATSASSASERLAQIGQPEHAAFWEYVRGQAYWCSHREKDLELAKDALREAVNGAPNTSWFIRLRRTLDELTERSSKPSGQDGLFLAWEEWIRDRSDRVLRELNQARQDLAGSHDQQAQGIETLGRLCGASADRPTGSSAADARWRWINPRRGERRLWEIKTGTASSKVARAEINQVLGQVTAEKRFAGEANVLGCLVTTCEASEADATAAGSDVVAILNSAAMLKLFDLMADRFREYFRQRGAGSAQERGDARTAVEARLPKPGWLERLLSPSSGTVRMPRDVEAEFSAG